ncbi:hypothetical protein [Candidatus Viadribacter manganicus]|uniref:Cellulose biosynthesis protein BcsS n=1 Tax=Candidatus Viadribacter manganicus TaxID=1759059 RepID=A0A1B1AKE4_9PROT|nr:hypothetical protein [Candidatus Viadribacter manganicus]ANP47038.1 hypothetical protein ATE48_14505 [Candidatus Viadribacter manganicus]
MKIRATGALAFAALTGAFTAPQANAEPGLAAEVESPIVVAGATELSLRGGELTGGEAAHDWQWRAEAGYAYVSWWRPGVAATWQGDGGDNALSGLGFENIFDFIPSRRWPVHFGAYAEYERNMSEGPDHIELKLLMQRQRGPLDLRFNIVSERETGDHSDNRWEFGYAAQGSYRVSPTLRLGVQGFGDTGFDDQLGDIDDYAHCWGPFAQVRLASVREQALSLQLGYLASSGYADADGQFRLGLEWSFGEDDDD